MHPILWSLLYSLQSELSSLIVHFTSSCATKGPSKELQVCIYLLKIQVRILRRWDFSELKECILKFTNRPRKRITMGHALSMSSYCWCFRRWLSLDTLSATLVGRFMGGYIFMERLTLNLYVSLAQSIYLSLRKFLAIPFLLNQRLFKNGRELILLWLLIVWRKYFYQL